MIGTKLLFSRLYVCEAQSVRHMQTWGKKTNEGKLALLVFDIVLSHAV